MDFYTEMVTVSFKTPESKVLDVANKNKHAASVLLDNNPSLCFPPKTGARAPYLNSIPRFVLDGKNEFSMFPDSTSTTQLSPIPSNVWYEDVIKWSDDWGKS